MKSVAAAVAAIAFLAGSIYLSFAPGPVHDFYCWSRIDAVTIGC